MLDVIATHLRQRAILLFPYLDHWLLRDLIRNQLVSHTIYCLQSLQCLGFIPNLKKSDLMLSQKFTFTGMEFLTQQNIVRVPADPVDFLLLTIKLFLSQTQVSAQTSLSLLGKLSAAADFVLLGRLHLRPLQMCLLSVWRPHILPLDHQVPINSMIRFHLKWWMDTNHFVLGTSIHPPYPNTFLFTDANHYGWGAHLELMRLSFHCPWSEDQSQLHINILEMMAIRLALKKAIKYIHHSCVMISTNNTTVVFYINKQGGTQSPNLCVEVWEILHWCLEHDIMISLSYSRQIQYIGRLPFEIGQTSQNRMALDQSVANSIFQILKLSQCGFVCDVIQSQTPIVCISSFNIQISHYSIFTLGSYQAVN